jgi:hypothetical protein
MTVKRSAARHQRSPHEKFRRRAQRIAGPWPADDPGFVLTVAASIINVSSSSHRKPWIICSVVVTVLTQQTKKAALFGHPAPGVQRLRLHAMNQPRHAAGSSTT